MPNAHVVSQLKWTGSSGATYMAFVYAMPTEKSAKNRVNTLIGPFLKKLDI